jgi:phage shock protein A
MSAMNNETIKKALKIAALVGVGFEARPEDAKYLLNYIQAVESENAALSAHAEKAKAERDEVRAMVERLIEEIDKHKGGYPVAGDDWYGMGNLHTLAAEWKEMQK